MSNRYFAFNSLAGCKRTSTLLKEDTTAGRFDSTYVANAILLPNATDYLSVSQPFLDGSTSLTTSFWLRFDHFTASNFNSGLPLWLTNSGANAYRITASTSTQLQFQYWNTGTSAWVNWGSTWSPSAASLHTWVLHLVPNVSFEIYDGGTLVTSSAVAPTNGVATITEFRFLSTNAGANAYVSQIMCADYDIRSAHLMPATFNGNSAANTGGTGSYTDINETVLDETTSEVVATVGNKMGQTHATVTIPSGLAITTVVLNARGRVSGGTVTDGKLGLRSGGTNYSSAARVYNGGYEPRGAAWDTDPNTSAAWTQSGWNAVETYLEAA